MTSAYEVTKIDSIKKCQLWQLILILEEKLMAKDIDWSNLGFGYIQTEKRYVSNFKDGAWDDGVLTDQERSFGCYQ